MGDSVSVAHGMNGGTVFPSIKVCCLQLGLSLHAENELKLDAGGVGIEGEDDSYDFGTGAGFYVDASEEKWKSNYRMYSYITKEVRLESQGCHLIPLSCLLSCFSAQFSCSFCVVIFRLMVRSPDLVLANSQTFFVKSSAFLCGS